MGSVDGGLSNTFQLTGVGQTVSIPLPTTNSDLLNSVILYNMSPYLISVDMGVSNKGWLGPFMVDRFTMGSQSSVKCTVNAIAGQNPSFPVPVAILSAAFVMKSETADNAGTYPIALLSSQAVIIASVLDIVYPNGTPALTAEGDQINFYDSSGRNVMRLDPVNGVQIAGGSGILPNFTGGTGVNISPLQSIIQFQPNGLVDPNAFGGSVQATISDVGNVSVLVLESGQSVFGGTTASLELSSDTAGDNVPHAIIYPPVQTTDPSFPRGSGPVESWHPLSLNSGWSNAFGVCSVRLNAIGAVEFKGTAIKSTGGVKGETISTLPSAYWPSRTIELAAAGDGNATPPNVMLQILTNGNINFYEGSSTASVAGFDGLSFYQN